MIAGTGAERIRFAAVMLLTVLISGFLVPVADLSTHGEKAYEDEHDDHG